MQKPDDAAGRHQATINRTSSNRPREAWQRPPPLASSAVARRILIVRPIHPYAALTAIISDSPAHGSHRPPGADPSSHSSRGRLRRLLFLRRLGRGLWMTGHG